MKKITFSFVVFLSLINLTIAFGQLSADSVGFIIERAKENGRSPGIAVGIIKDTVWQTISCGQLVNENVTEPGPNNLFEIGSITKTFTTLVLADMVVKGEVNLNDPISKFLPKSVKTPTRNGKEITLLDLATHTSGLPRLPDNLNPKDINNPYMDYTAQNLYDFLSHYTLTRDIGSQYEYSNLGVGLLGHILTLVSGKDYETLLNERICLPLKMENTTLTLTSEQKKKLAKGHDADGKEVENWDFNVLAGCGAIHSTVNDLIIYVRANMGLMETPLTPAMKLQHIICDSNTFIPDLYIALGWHIYKKYGRTIYWHNGETGGYHSFIGFEMVNKSGVVVLSNSDNSIDDIALHILDSRFPVYHLDKVLHVPDTILKKYVGVYKKDDGTTRSVTMEGNTLWYHTQTGASGKMYFTSDTDFFTYLFNADFSFDTDISGKVTGLKYKGGKVFARKN